MVGLDTQVTSYYGTLLLWYLALNLCGRNSTENLDAREGLSSPFVILRLRRPHVVLLSELHRAQEAGISMHEMTGKYYLSRAELGSKIDMHLGIEDYAVCIADRSWSGESNASIPKLALQAHDEHQLFLVRQNLRDLRNIYMSLYDNVKNVLA